MDINLLPARIKDLKEISYKSNSPKFIGFLTVEETAVAVKQFASCNEYTLFGGYEDAERVVLGVLPDWCDECSFPVKAITFKYRECDKLSHRDFLGALMSLGIARETVGDILVASGRTVVFVRDDILSFVMTQINKIGNVGVETVEGYTEPLPQTGEKLPFVATVASMRIDCVVATVCNVSRNCATEKIADGCVFINSICVTKPTTIVRAGDKVTVRKTGKFYITDCDQYSKKGRIILKYDKYSQT